MNATIGAAVRHQQEVADLRHQRGGSIPKELQLTEAQAQACLTQLRLLATQQRVTPTAEIALRTVQMR